MKSFDVEIKSMTVTGDTVALGIVEKNGTATLTGVVVTIAEADQLRLGETYRVTLSKLPGRA